jgi:predicted AAA+ superfamily ATPase
MKALKQLCTPRKSVFDVSKRDTVLNLTHLTDDKISAAEFFEENSVTEGMRTLLIEAHRRLQGKSSQAVFKLTQAMGGGKTHNLIALGLLAKTPKLRPSILKDLPGAKELPPVRVVAFSGRETDIPNGIWGEVARQLGKEQAFKDYYQPLKAPGRSAWINLLKGEPTLILLDELPPYLDNAKSVSVGNSDLSKVTATALTNLFEAVAEADLSNVCVVITDLVGTYAEASAQIQGLLEQLQNEAQRHSMDLTPVQMNTDEFYQILRKRLFEKLPSDAEIDKVAQEYAKAVREAKQMDITAQSPEQFAALIKTSYPFHPAIKDLYARFRENRGFQQTRALIRLMRIITSGLWKSDEADKKYLISVQDINLNDAETLSEIRQINPNLENAVAHDIAAQGKAVAEFMDENLTGTDARDACRLLFMAYRPPICRRSELPRDLRVLYRVV